MNVKLLRKVKKHILEEPRRFYMTTLAHRAAPGTRVRLDGIEREMPKCGTAACIAGWTCILSEEDLDRNSAERVLGISRDQGSLLFFEHNWPAKFKDKWNATSDLGERANIAAGRNGRIEHFIKTGE